MGAILLVQFDPETTQLFCGAAGALQNELVETVAEPQQLMEYLKRNPSGVDALVLGPRVGEPVRIAQQVYNLNKEIAIFILSGPERQQQLLRDLQFAPFLGEYVVCRSVTEGQKLPEELREILTHIRQRRRYQATVAALNTRLANAIPSRIQPTQYLEQLLDHLPIGIVTVDLQGLILGWNRKAKEIIGKEEREVQGRHLAQLFSPPAQTQLHSLITEGSATNGQLAPAVFEIVDAKHQTHFVEVHAAPLSGGNGKAGALVLLQDVTERIIAAREREQLLASEHTARMAAEAAEQRFRDLVHELDAIVWEADPATIQFTFVSQRAKDILGYPIEQWLTDPDFFDNILHPDDREHTLALYQQIVASDRQMIPEYRVVAADGRSVWLRDNVYVVRDALGNPRQLRGLMVDISARKFAEEERLRLHNYVRLLLESAGEGIFGIDLNGRCTFINPAGARMLGYEPGDVLGQNMHDLIHHTRANGAPYPVEDCPIYQAALSGRSAHLEDELLWRRDLTAFPAEYATYPVIEAGAIKGAVVTFSDITERKHAEEERAQLLARERAARAQAEAAQRRLAFLAEAGAVLASSLDYETTLGSLTRLVVPELADFCVVDMLEEDGTIRRMAVAHRDPAKEELARELQHRYPPQMNKPNPVVTVLRTGTPNIATQVPSDALLHDFVQDEEHLRIIRELGVKAYMIVPICAREKMLGALSFIATETDRHYSAEDLALAEELARRAALAVENARLYRETQEAVRAREIFLSIASHELKTPLTSLLGYTELLQRRTQHKNTLSERDQRALGIIFEQSNRLNRMVSALLDISRIQTGQLNIEQAELDLVALVRRLVAETQPSLERHTIEFSGLETPLIIIGDELRLEQVFQNLIGNAIKYSPEGGPVYVQVEQQDNQACVRVIDQGIGIPESALPNLFRRFYRANNVEWQRISGIGIGLYVVKEIVMLHDGDVQVHSREGHGSTFSVYLPLADTRDSAPPDSSVGTTHV